MTLLYQIGEESPLAGGAVAATCAKIKKNYAKKLGGDLRVSLGFHVFIMLGCAYYVHELNHRSSTGTCRRAWSRFCRIASTIPF